MFKRLPGIGINSRAIEMSPRFVLGRENVPCAAEVVNRSLKADCTDFNCSYLILQSKEMFHLEKIKEI